jgi:outer membrane protein OmpA-like peptidoglycan-associated protein
MNRARVSAVLLAIAGSLGTACAGRRVPAPGPLTPTLVVLLADEETGTTGRARVTNDFGSVELSNARDATLATSNSRPSPVGTISEAEMAQVFDAAIAAIPPPPRNFTLLFKFEADELTDESRALFPAILNAVKSIDVPEVVIIGHTDTMGDAESNVALGMMRATSVRGLLVEAGIDAATIAVRSHGEADLLIATSDDTPEPRNRRVEVTVR